MTTERSQELSSYVRRFPSIPDNHAHGSLRDRDVAVIGACDDDLVSAIIEAGARHCYVVASDGVPSAADRVTVLRQDPLTSDWPAADVAFFDARRAPEFDYVHGTAALARLARRALRHGGSLFCVLSTGSVNHGFDVYNPIVRSATRFLPSQEYLFKELLGDCAIRMLDWMPSPDPLMTTRFFRVTPKQPTLLLVLGRSQSGKTSLARDLQGLDSQIHVSNDYIYCEIVERARSGFAADIPPDLVRQAGDGSGAACGKFNRAIEQDLELLRQYVGWLVHLLPRNKRVISVDFDLIQAEAVAVMKEMLRDAGFSVWTVMR